MKTIQFGVVGIHGFSRTHIRSLRDAAAAGDPVRLVACLAHERNRDEAYAAELEAAGVTLVPALADLLAMRDSLDVITLPVGIHLHAPMAHQALAAGYHVYLEKPLVGAIQDGLALAKAAEQAKGRLFIGYQDMYQPVSVALKRDLLAGALGRLRSITVMAAWPRNNAYYARNNWAGKLSAGGSWIFDSPVNNACAHYLNLALFWAGPSESESASPTAVTAELARANPIESADTTALRVETAEGVEVVFVASHACRTLRGPLFRIVCDQGVIETQRGGRVSTAWTVTRPGQAPETRGETFKPVIPQGVVARVLNGESRPVGTVQQALAQTRAVNGAFLSSPIVPIPDAVCDTATLENGTTLRFVPAMNAILDACYDKGCLPTETGLAPWLKSGKRVDVRDLRAYA